MSRNIHTIIKSEYEKRRQSAYDRLLERERETYTRIPELSDIDGQIKLSGIRFNKMLLLGDRASSDIVAELLSKIDALKSEKTRLLVNSGYPANFLEPDYQCQKCKDTGFVEGEDGTEKCTCYKQQVLSHLYTLSNLKLTESENFSTFSDGYYPDNVDRAKYGIPVSPRENIINIKSCCIDFVENFDSRDEKNLFFSGPTGVGKTFMANCIASELINRGYTVLYQTAPMLFQTVNDYKMKSFREENYEDGAYRSIFDTELLIIDDLGTETPSAAKYAELLTILNTRQIANLTKPCKTLISTNISLKKLNEYYDERIVSRIIGGFRTFWFAGEDIRGLKKLNGR